MEHTEPAAEAQAHVWPQGPSRAHGGRGVSIPGEGAAASGGLGRSGRMCGKGMLTVLPLWGLEKPLEDGEMEPRERSPSEARFFSGRGGCPGRGEPCRVGPWWLLWPGAVARKPWGRKPLSAAPDAVRGVLGGWGAPWELPGRVPRSSPGGRPLPMGAVPKPRKAWLLRGPRASGGPTRDSSCLWRAEWSSAGGRCGQPGPSVLGPVNSLVPRRLPGGRLPPSRARVGWGLVSTHRCSVDGALVGRQNGQRGPRCEEMARNQPHVSGLGKTGLERRHAPGPRLPPPPALLITRRVRPLRPVRLCRQLAAASAPCPAPACTRGG